MSGHTPIPNILIDQYMPRLRDTEWRILLVVVRQTLGWADKHGNRKELDWISHVQFQVKTGRGGDAVSNAIDYLVRQGFIEVLDGKRRFLPTKASRKSRFARLYYRVGPVLQEAIDKSTRAARLDQVGTTKDSLNKRNVYKRGTRKASQGDFSKALADPLYPKPYTHATHRLDRARLSDFEDLE